MAGTATTIVASQLTGQAALTQPDATRPNVVLIMADDVGWSDIG